MCRFKTSPCEGSKRLLVYRQNARMSSTCARSAGTHGGVLNLHTETFGTYTRGRLEPTHGGFSACQAAPLTPHTPHTLSAHTSHTLSTHTHNHFNTHAQHTTRHIHIHIHTTTPHTHHPHTTHITHHTHTNAWTRAQLTTDRDLERASTW